MMVYVFGYLEEVGVILLGLWKCIIIRLWYCFIMINFKIVNC